jgi:steroid 5-alpha reductase family enzyme
MFDITAIQVTAVFVYMNFWFLFAVTFKRNDIADTVWGPGFMMLALIGAFFNPTNINVLVALMVSLWALRLAWHIGSRLIKKREEDRRYKNWRQGWGDKWVIRSWLNVFMFQGLLMLIVSLAFLPANLFDTGAKNPLNLIGFLIFLIGFSFEAIGDWQLKKFISRSDKKSKVMQSGLWRYTRHPNYFGEVVLWWGIWLATGGTPYFFLGIIGPLSITFLILKVSGIPLLEQKYVNDPDFEEYKKRTNAFFPWFPKKNV